MSRKKKIQAQKLAPKRAQDLYDYWDAQAARQQEEEKARHIAREEAWRAALVEEWGQLKAHPLGEAMAERIRDLARMACRARDSDLDVDRHEMDDVIYEALPCQTFLYLDSGDNTTNIWVREILEFVAVEPL